VFAAIAQHRQAAAATNAAQGPHLAQALRNEQNALKVWLTTPPTTMAGVLVTLEHDSRRPYDGIEGEDTDATCELTNLVESIVAAGQIYPAMVANALRQILR
jgi:hypothetical protein